MNNGMGRRTAKRFQKNKTDVSRRIAKDKENIVPTDASTTALGFTLWQKQDDGNTRPIAFESRYLNETEKKIGSVT